MPQETEIKLRVQNLKSFLNALKKLGAKPSAARVHEHNLLFDTPEGGLAKHGQLLRIRTETSAASSALGATQSRKRKPAVSQKTSRILLTFKSPPEQLAIGSASPPQPSSRYKIREETELVLTDGASLQKIFEGLGLKGWFRYEKFRTPYRLPTRLSWAKGLVIDVDETPIGTFVELEGPGPAIDEAARRLGFSPRDYIAKNYLVLYLDDCKRRSLQPTHMLFPER
jgi:adenylate cyclase, class 2